MTTKEILSKIGFYILLAAIFITCAVIVVAFAIGYKVDFKNKEITQTGMIIVKTDNSLNEIYIDDKKEGEGNVILRNANPKTYTTSISREGYQSFNRSFYLNPGEARIIDNIVLFYNEPEISEFAETTSVPFKRLSDTSRITLSKNELFVNDEFLTRFESNIQDASWFTNERYIGVTINNRFRMIDIETLNTFDLFEKKSNMPAVFINSGKAVLFESDGKLFTAQIR